MARLRLFAGLREAAGASLVEVPGATVAEVLDRAKETYGDEFSSGLAAAKVWVNGEPAGPEADVGEADEVALIPPVSGGDATIEIPTAPLVQLGVVGALALALLVSNLVSLRVFVFVAVATGIAWVWDVADTSATRTVAMNPLPSFLAIAAAANGAYRWGFGGFAGGLALGVIIALTWGSFDPTRRRLDSLAVTVLVAVYGSIAAGSLVLVRMRTAEEVTAFLAVAFIAGTAAWAATHFGERVPLLDPNLTSFVAALLTGLVAALVVERLSIPVMLLASAAIAAGLVAGRAFGSLVRAGDVLHTEHPPGLIAILDGPFLAAGLYWLVLISFT